MAQSNFYDLLAVSREATAEEIKKAYKRAALTHHPDKGGDPEKFKECGAALETLTDDRKRAGYDHMLVVTRSQDGRGGSLPRQSSGSRPPSERPPAAPAAPAGGGVPRSAGSASRPPRPPGGAVEIPADPGSLSGKELKELLSALGIDHDGCLEKSELLELLQHRKERRPGRDSTPRGGPAAESDPRRACSPRRGSQGTGGATASGTSAAGSAAPKPTAGSGGRALRIKIMSLGAAAVGKSTLIKRYCEGRFVQKYITTIGIDYGVKPVKVSGFDVKVNFFDTSGGDEFKDIRVEFYKNASGALLVYDVCSRKSFTDLELWLEEARRNGLALSKLHRSGETPFVAVCANKVDLPRRAVDRAEGMAFASRHGMYYYETSAASGDQVVEAMTFLFEKVVGNHVETRTRLGAG